MDAVSVAKINALTKMMKNVSKIVTVTHTTSSLASGAGEQISLVIDNEEINKMLVKSVVVKGSGNSQIDLEIKSSAGTTGFTSYKNVVGNSLYDVLDLPYVDDDKTGKVHLIITNVGEEASAFDIRITGLSTL